MSAIGRVLLPSLAFALIPAALLSGATTPGKITYVGGTVEAIPVNSVGTFSFEDAKNFQFKYGSSVYKLPYAQITGTDISRAELRRVHRIPVPALTPSRWKDVLTISYKDSSGTAGTLKFEMPTMSALEARQQIADKTSPAGESAATTKDNQWWGDQYWKTLRNKSAWDAQDAQANQASQATQASQPAPGGTK